MCAKRCEEMGVGELCATQKVAKIPPEKDFKMGVGVKILAMFPMSKGEDLDSLSLGVSQTDIEIRITVFVSLVITSQSNFREVVRV